MIYVTTYSNQDGAQPVDIATALQHLYAGTPVPATINHNLRYRQTHTKIYDAELVRELHTQPWLSQLIRTADRCIQFKNRNPDTETWYTTFHIPKRSGGFRRIDAPIPALKDMQREVLEALTKDPAIGNTTFVHSHNAAHAYIEHRSTVTAMQLHQHNQSWWFLKMDLKDFFPSITPTSMQFILKSLYPFCFVQDSVLEELLSVCFWHGGLPQGAVTSPTLSNLYMVPFDKALSDQFYNWNRRTHIYTRYADDILISGRERFDWVEAAAFIKQTAEQYNLQVKEEKTRFGSRAGRNWNLGLMLNKDNDLTLGNERKQKYRAMIWNFLMDYKNHVEWSVEDVQILQGRINYLRQIEPAYVSTVIERYNRKTGCDFQQIMHDYLSH